MQWWKCPHGLPWSQKLVTLSMAAFGVWFHVASAADGDGYVRPSPGTTVEETVLALCKRDPVAAIGWEECVTKGVVSVVTEGVFVPERAGLTLQGKAVAGPGSRGGLSDSERQKRRRERLRDGKPNVTGDDPEPVTAPVTTPVTESVTGTVTGVSRAPSRADSVTVTDANRDTSRVTVTAHMATETAETKAVSVSVTESVTDVTAGRHGLSRAVEREEKTERETTTETSVTTSRSLRVTDQMDVDEALHLIAQSSKQQFSPHCDRETKYRLAELMREVKVTKRHLEVMGAVICRKPAWAKSVTGPWNASLLVGSVEKGRPGSGFYRVFEAANGKILEADRLHAEQVERVRREAELAKAPPIQRRVPSFMRKAEVPAAGGNSE